MPDTQTSESPQDQKQLRNRIARIHGQINGIKKMIEDDSYCIDLINQIHSVERALDSLATQIMDDHLKGCVRDAIESDDPYEEQEKIEEFMNTVEEFLKK